MASRLTGSSPGAGATSSTISHGAISCFASTRVRFAALFDSPFELSRPLFVPVAVFTSSVALANAVGVSASAAGVATSDIFNRRVGSVGVPALGRSDGACTTVGNGDDVSPATRDGDSNGEDANAARFLAVSAAGDANALNSASPAITPRFVVTCAIKLSNMLCFNPVSSTGNHKPTVSANCPYP